MNYQYWNQTPLQIRLYGKLYRHNVLCSGSLRKPVGEPGCICLKFLRQMALELPAQQPADAAGGR